MLNENNLVEKLYLQEGFSVGKIADILEINQEKVNNIMKGCAQYSLLTSTREYNIRRMSDKEYTRLREKTLSIEPMYMFSTRMDKYLENHNCKGIPEIYFSLSYFFGQSSEIYDSHKSSFRYLFHLEITKKDSKEIKGKYIVSIGDVKQNVYVKFYKIAAGRSEEDYSKYHSPFSDLKEKEMKKIWFWFIAFIKNTVDYFNNREIKIKPFCKQIDYGYVIYGYKNKEFFIEQYLEGQNMDKNRELFCEQYEKYNQEIAEEIEKNDYKNESTEIISKIIEKTNSESMPDFEFHNIEFEIYKVAVNHFEEETRKELEEKADLLTELMLHYFVFEKESSKKEYFKENNQLSDLTLTEFKKTLDQVKENWAAEEYTDKEVRTALNYYKFNYLRGLRFSIIKQILDIGEGEAGDILNQAVGQLTEIESRQKLLRVIEIVRESSSSHLVELIDSLAEEVEGFSYE